MLIMLLHAIPSMLNLFMTTNIIPHKIQLVFFFFTGDRPVITAKHYKMSIEAI